MVSLLAYEESQTETQRKQATQGQESNMGPPPRPRALKDFPTVNLKTGTKAFRRGRVATAVLGRVLTKSVMSDFCGRADMCRSL